MVKQYKGKQMGGKEKCFDVTKDGDKTIVGPEIIKLPPAGNSGAAEPAGNSGNSGAAEPAGNSGAKPEPAGNSGAKPEPAAAESSGAEPAKGGARRKRKPTKKGGACGKASSSMTGGKTVPTTHSPVTGGSSKKGSPKHKYNGREYSVHTGTRGGKYILVKGEKKYIN
jgi:hypothetical protein